MNKKEILQKNELLRTNNTESTVSISALSLDQVESVYAERKNMLSGIEMYINPHFQSILRIKINNERKQLLDILAANTKKTHVVEKPAQILDDRYFIQKHLDQNIF
ncbi:MAG: hypothetical protein WCV55_00250 [Candidatus Paceibacterota bacterium]